MSLFVERRLRGVTRKIQRARDDLAVTNEQLDQLRDESADAELRAIVADDPSAVLDHNEAARHRDAMERHRSDLIDTIARLEVTQDELLDELTAQRKAGS